MKAIFNCIRCKAEIVAENFDDDTHEIDEAMYRIFGEYICCPNCSNRHLIEITEI